MPSTSGPSVRYAYPKYKVYIFGVNVTADVTSVKVSSHDGSAPNICSIQLQGPLDRYIINTDDVCQINNIKVSPVSPFLRSSPITDNTSTNDSAFGKAISDPDRWQTFDSVKARVLEAKRRVTQNLPLNERKDLFGLPVSPDFARYYSETISKYPLSDGLPIFHPMDPVRVFMRNPFDPSRWYYHFSGFVSDLVETIGSNNEKELMLQVEDPMKLFRYTRVFINPGIVDARVQVQDQDLKAQSFNAHYYKGFDLPEIVFTQVFGPDRVGATSLQQRNVSADGRETPISTRLRGIGHFQYDKSGIFTFGPDGAAAYDTLIEDAIVNSLKDTRLNERTFDTTAGRINDLGTSVRGTRNRGKTKLYNDKTPKNLQDLSQWQYLIDHEVQPSDLYMMYSAGSLVARGRVSDIIASAQLGPDGLIDAEWVADYIGSRPDEYQIDGGRVMILLPNSLGYQNRNIVVRDIINSYPLNSEWQSAAEILYDIIDKLEFSIYCTPKGDLVIEPPLYDFDPTNFGMSTVQLGGDIETSIDPATAVAEATFPSRPRGPFGPNYVVTNGDLESFESAFTDDKIHTIAVISKQIFPGWESLPNSSIVGDLIVARRPDLIPIYGVRPVPVTQRNYVSTEAGASMYANLLLNKLNADAHTITLSMAPNINMWINRPIYIEKRNCIATTKAVTHDLQWGARGSMSTTIDLHATRTWTGKLDERNRPIYDAIGGAGGSPLDYSVLFRSKPRVQIVQDIIAPEDIT